MPSPRTHKWVEVFATCPNCGDEYPDFHGLSGTAVIVCDHCGWSNVASHSDIWVPGTDDSIASIIEEYGEKV